MPVMTGLRRKMVKRMEVALLVKPFDIVRLGGIVSMMMRCENPHHELPPRGFDYEQYVRQYDWSKIFDEDLVILFTRIIQQEMK